MTKNAAAKAQRTGVGDAVLQAPGCDFQTAGASASCEARGCWLGAGTIGRAGGGVEDHGVARTARRLEEQRDVVVVFGQHSAQPDEAR